MPRTPNMFRRVWAESGREAPSCGPVQLLCRRLGLVVAGCVFLPLLSALFVTWTVLGLLLTAPLPALLTVEWLLLLLIAAPLLRYVPSAPSDVFINGMWDAMIASTVVSGGYLVAWQVGALPKWRVQLSWAPVTLASFLGSKIIVAKGTGWDLRLRLAWLWTALFFLSVSYICAAKIWVDASMEQLLDAEGQLLRRYAGIACEQRVVAGLGTVFPTSNILPAGGGTVKPNLVLMHGYASGNAFWFFNIAELSKTFRVWCVEMYGCGRSVRGPWDAQSPDEAEEIIVSALERWRQEMGIGSFFLCGHSLGGMFSAAYALSHPDVVTALVLASPVGVGPLPDGWQESQSKTWGRRVLSNLWSRGFTPLAPIRWMGPLGLPFTKWIVYKRRQWAPRASNMIRMEPDLFARYVYQNWALHPSGEQALRAMLLPGAYARVPLVEKFNNALALAGADHKLCPVNFIYGDPEIDWMESRYGHELADQLRSAGGHAEVFTVSNAGHQLFLDNTDGFNQTLLGALESHMIDGLRKSS
jgi:pimeloyl-ACP methyl ester carboxylesterase